jgi:hypothetical protein
MREDFNSFDDDRRRFSVEYGYTQTESETVMKATIAYNDLGGYYAQRMAATAEKTPGISSPGREAVGDAASLLNRLCALTEYLAHPNTFLDVVPIGDGNLLTPEELHELAIAQMLGVDIDEAYPEIVARLSALRQPGEEG